MWNKILLACVSVVVVEVGSAPARLPVPSRLRYGPTVPIAKAAAEAALGYSSSVPSVVRAPLPYGTRMSKSVPLALSASAPVHASHAAYPSRQTHGAYPARLSVHAAPVRVTPLAPRFTPAAPLPVYSKPRGFVAAPVYRPPVLSVPVVSRPPPLLTATALAAPITKLPPTLAKAALVEPFYPAQPYSFGYESVDEYGNRQSREEQSDSNNFKKGSYSYTDAYGISRRVDYVADAAGFRATINTNEPGTAHSSPAAAQYNKAEAKSA